MTKLLARMVCFSTVPALIAIVSMTNIVRASGELSRGHDILVQRGLQIQASCPEIPTTFENWDASNFTGVFFWSTYPNTIMPPAPGIPWGIRYTDYVGDVPNGTWDAYMSQMVSLQYFDEQDITVPGDQALLGAAMESFHINQPHVITYTNQWGSQHTAAELQ